MTAQIIPSLFRSSAASAQPTETASARREASDEMPVGVTRNDMTRGRAAVGYWKNRDFLRLKDFAIHLAGPAPGKRFLDVGCSSGATMVYCGLQGATVFGQDLDPESVEEANETLKRFGIEGEARCGDAVALDFPDNHFDAVVSNDFFEHVTDDVKVAVFREVRRVLKPGGVMVVRTPNLSYLKVSLFVKRLAALARFRNPFNLVIPHTPGTSDPQHVGLTSRWKLSRRLDEAGFVNYQFHYAPLRRFGNSPFFEVLSTEAPVLRDVLSEDLVCRTYKPITLSHFPD